MNTKKQSKLRKVLNVMLIGTLICLGYAQGADDVKQNLEAGKLFNGHWSFMEHKGWLNAADVEFTITGSNVTGTWSYGNRERGWSGSLKGRLIDSRLYVSRCYDPGSGYGDESPVCPHYEAADGYFIRSGDHLTWYTKRGKSYTKLFVLTHARQPDIEQLNELYGR